MFQAKSTLKLILVNNGLILNVFLNLRPVLRIAMHVFQEFRWLIMTLATGKTEMSGCCEKIFSLHDLCNI